MPCQHDVHAMSRQQCPNIIHPRGFAFRTDVKNRVVEVGDGANGVVRFQVLNKPVILRGAGAGLVVLIGLSSGRIFSANSYGICRFVHCIFIVFCQTMTKVGR
jgi:hypothetical protein